MKKIKCIFAIIGYFNPVITEDLVLSFKKFLPQEEIWLFDNSLDPALRSLAKKYHLKYLSSKKNLGYSGGSNKVIDKIIQKKEDCDVICILNNDVLIDKSFAKQLPKSLANFTSQKKVAAMTPILFQDPDFTNPENFGIFYYHSGLAVQNRTGKISKKRLLNGSFLFLKKIVCQKIIRDDGFMFQPLFFFNGEDVELSLRLISRGYQLKIDKDLKAVHLGKKSIGSSPLGYFLSWRNLLWVIIITRSKSAIFYDFLAIIIGQLILLLLSLKYTITQKKISYLTICFKVAQDTEFKWPELMRAREQFISPRKFNVKNNFKGVYAGYFF